VFSAYPTSCISSPPDKAVILRACDFLDRAQKRLLSMERAVVDGKGVPPPSNCPVPSQLPYPFATVLFPSQLSFSLRNCPFPFNNPLLFVIPSEAEGSAVRHSGAPNLPFYNFKPPDKAVADLSQTEALWRGVEKPVLSEAEGTSAILVSRCCSGFSGRKLQGK
jgi:hypothetical protein